MFFFLVQFIVNVSFWCCVQCVMCAEAAREFICEFIDVLDIARRHRLHRRQCIALRWNTMTTASKFRLSHIGSLPFARKLVEIDEFNYIYTSNFNMRYNINFIVLIIWFVKLQLMPAAFRT